MNRITIAALLPIVLAASAQGQPVNQQLGGGSSYLREECLGPCACAIHIIDPSPMTGTFTLTLDHQDQWTRYYNLSAVSFHSSTQFEPTLTLEGVGTYHVGGDFALTQRLTLDLAAAGSSQTYHYDSGEVVVQSGPYFPEIAISATTGVVGCQRRTVVVHSAPVAPCAADVGKQGGAPGSDGHLDNNDFIVFIDAFFNGNPVADRGGQGGTPGPDGAYDNNDFVVFIDQFFNATGC